MSSSGEKNLDTQVRRIDNDAAILGSRTLLNDANISQPVPAEAHANPLFGEREGARRVKLFLQPAAHKVLDIAVLESRDCPLDDSAIEKLGVVLEAHTQIFFRAYQLRDRHGKAYFDSSA